jgi:predicted HTH domain antitoxin
MEKFTLEVSGEISDRLRPYQDKLGELVLLGLQQLKIQEALLLYTRGLVSFGRAAELAGLPEKEMIRQARAAGVEPRWSKDMFEEELM